MTYGEELKDKLFKKKVNGWFKISDELKKEIAKDGVVIYEKA